MSTEAMNTPHDHDERMRAARRVAHWHLGHGDWADRIVTAYIDPKGALDALARDKADD